MKANQIGYVLAVAVVTLLGCSKPHAVENTNPPKPADTKPASGFNPHLGSEIVTHQYWEQKYGCDSKMTSNDKSYVHEGYPDVKINPRRNIQVDRATFTNLTLEKPTPVVTLTFAGGEGLEKFRIFITPRRDEQPLGRIFGPPLVEVSRGDNRIGYKYESCQKRENVSDDPKATPVCVQWFTEEEGEVLLTVGVTEKTEHPEVCRKYPNCPLGFLTTYKECEWSR